MSSGLAEPGSPLPARLGGSWGQRPLVPPTPGGTSWSVQIMF